LESSPKRVCFSARPEARSIGSFKAALELVVERVGGINAAPIGEPNHRPRAIGQLVFAFRNHAIVATS